MAHDESTTDLSLLHRVRDPSNHEAWDRFAQRYGHRILEWCLNWGTQHTDAEEITQSVLVQLSKQLRSFEYKPGGSFRSWLRVVAYRAWCDFLRTQQAQPVPLTQADIIQQLDEQSSREDLLNRLDDEFEMELLELMMKRVEKVVHPQTWKAFYLTAIEGHSSVEVARELSTTVANVYQAKSRILKLLKREKEKLDQGESITQP